MHHLLFDTIVSISICVVIGIFVWFRLRSIEKASDEDVELLTQQTAKLFMRAGDWGSALVNVVIGVLLGMVIHGVFGLLLDGAWFAVANIAALFVALSFIVVMHDRIGQKLFPSGIRPAHKPKAKRKKPMVRRISFPLGLAVGITLGSLGFDALLLGRLV